MNTARFLPPAQMVMSVGSEPPKKLCAVGYFSLIFHLEILVTSKFGETAGIPLKTHCEDALEPNHSDLFYTMSFEKVSLPAVVLQKLLDTKPQPEGEPHEETNE